MSLKILIVDDDIALTKTLQRVLTLENYDTIVAYTAEDGLQMAVNENPDLVLLDVMIPAIGGWETCRRLREHSSVPVIFLTALGTSKDIVHGLEIGADDYIVKPFEPSIILARINAQLRRFKSLQESPSRLSFDNGALVIDLDARTVTRHGEYVELTRREFDLLCALATNSGRVMTADDLSNQAWGKDYNMSSDSIKPYIHYLRKKIEPDSTSPRWVLTVRGIGYRFSSDPA